MASAQPDVRAPQNSCLRQVAPAEPTPGGQRTPGGQPTASAQPDVRAPQNSCPQQVAPAEPTQGGRPTPGGGWRIASAEPPVGCVGPAPSPAVSSLSW